MKGRTCVGIPPSDQPPIPKGIQEATYKEMLDMVGILRPATLSLRLGWIDLKKVRTAMSASCLLNVISNSVAQCATNGVPTQ